MNSYNVWVKSEVQAWKNLGYKIAYVNVANTMNWNADSDFYFDNTHYTSPGNGMANDPGLNNQGINKMGPIIFTALARLCGYQP